MYIRVVLSAKIGKDYQTREIGAVYKEDGTFSIDLPKDVDVTKTFTMIFEPQTPESFEV